MSDCEAIILAGGFGTRLRSVVSDRPKVLARVGGRPFLMRLLDQLANAKIKTVVISTGYMAEMVEAEIGAKYRDMEILYSKETEPLGTGGGLRLALEKTSADLVFALNGDSFCDVKLNALREFHAAANASATLTLVRVGDTSRFGCVEADASGAVMRFEEKGGARAAGWINAGVYSLSREVIAQIPSRRVVSIERDVFPALINRGLHGYRCEGKFLDIGTPESYAQAEQFFAGPIRSACEPGCIQ